MIRGMRFFNGILVVSALAVLSSVAQAPAPIERVEIAPGVTYSHLRRTTPVGELWSIHVLELDRREKSIRLKAIEGRRPEDQVQSELPTAIAFPGTQDRMWRELPTAMAARAATAGEDVLAVVNGDYDLAIPHMGIPDGLSVTSGRLWTTGKPNWPVFGVTDKGEPLIDVPNVEIVLEAGNVSWNIAALNKPLGSAHGSGLRAFTREFGRVVESTQPLSVVEIGKLSSALPLRAGRTVRGRVISSFERLSGAALPGDSLIVVQPTPTTPAERALFPAKLRPGQRVKLHFRVRLGGREKIREAIGGFPILVKDGRVSLTGTPTEYLRRRHPRTAVCYNAGKIILVVVDGRQPQLSVGMTLEELADLMVALGCTVAMNTDGGGSSVMAVALPAGAEAGARAREGASAKPPLQIVNSPSDGTERGRGNAWLVVRKE